jgi:hypothetical protein
MPITCWCTRADGPRPVGLKEAALDSPSFRAAAVHFCEQVEQVEKWLDNYVKQISRLSGALPTLESAVNGFLAATAPPAQLSEAMMDPDYTFLAAKTFAEGSKDLWTSVFGGMRKLEANMTEPIRAFLRNDLHSFKVPAPLPAWPFFFSFFLFG